MSGRCRRLFAPLRIAAGILCVTFTLTQAAPAWALRPVEPGPGTPVQTGLEEALQVPRPVGEAVGGSVVAPAGRPEVVARDVPAGVFLEALRQLRALPPEDRTTHAMTLRALEVFRDRLPASMSNKIPAADRVAGVLQTLQTRGPRPDCPTCGAAVASAVLSDPFTHPEADRPEALQSREFQEAEVLNALLLALSVVHHGRILTLQSEDGHVMPANTAADVRDLLTLMEAQPAYPEGMRRQWIGGRMTPGQLQGALAEGQTVVAYVGGDHFVRVVAVTDDWVEFTDLRRSATTGLPESFISREPRQQFLQRWAQGAQTGVVLVGARPGQLLGIHSRLSDADLAKVQGSCGINAVFGHFRSVQKILSALFRLKYRAPDDTGIMVVTADGLVVRKVQGPPDLLILDLLDQPLYPEALGLPADSGQNREAITQYRGERRTLLMQEGLAELAPAAWEDPGRLLTDLHASSIEGLYAGHYTVGIGNVGGLYAGWVYTLGASVDQYQALNGPSLRLRDLVSRWDLAPEFFRLFIRHRLTRELEERQVPPAQAADTIGVFDRLADRAMKNTLDAQGRTDWDSLWSRYLQGRTIQISSDYNRDPVRHVFRLLDQLVGAFRVHPEWAEEVQRRFDARRPAVAAAGRAWDWREHWRMESRYNMPGHAWAALVEWVQDWLAAQAVVPEAIRQAWVALRDDQQARRGFSEGTVDLPLLLVLPEIVLGHGRWAMTGDPKWWNGHPQTTTERAIVHNGAIEADKNNELRQEHAERYKTLMQAAAREREARPYDAGAMARAQALEEDARRNYGRFEDSDGLQEIVTDTRTIVRQWQLIADGYAADRAAGLAVGGLIDPAQPGSLNRPGQRYEGREVYDRAAAWNTVVENLRASEGAPEPPAEEVALRVAMLEMALGSGIAADGYSLVTPQTEYVVSHDRPVDIVVYQHRGPDGRVLYEDYMVTSDKSAGIGLFPASEVMPAAHELVRLKEGVRREIDQLQDQLASHRLSEADFARRIHEQVQRLQEGQERITRGEQVAGLVDGRPAVQWKGGFHVTVYQMKGAERFAKITRRLNAEGQQVVEIRFSKLNGEPLDQPMQPRDVVVNPALGDRGTYASYMELHIDEIPLILLQQVLGYLQGDTVTLDAVFPEGTVPEIRQGSDRLHTRLAGETPPARPGVNSAVLRAHFGPGAGLEDVATTNRLPGLKRVILVGVGSSWRDAMIAKRVFEELLPGVEILVYDPVQIQNGGVVLDPHGDLIVGMSWSGETDSMLKLFHRLDEDGFMAIVVTGKPESTLGGIGERAGGTVDVLSGDETTVATTKGFESVLNVLCMLAVHLSQLQGDPSLEPVRREYAGDFRRVARLVYDVLAEREVPRGQRVLDLEDPDSVVNRLGRQYAKRQKFLVIGSRNVPIGDEGELKGEEIASIVGLSADIEDASWQATVVPNHDPRFPEEEKVIVVFDMTDPDRLGAFMSPIRELAAAGAGFIVLTYQSADHPHYEELEALAAQHPDRIHLVVVPKVRPTLQPLINALFYFRFGAAIAKGRGMTAEEIENSRNLAKSVTVSYAQSLRELLETVKTKVITMARHADEATGRLAQKLQSHFNFLAGPGGVWDRMGDPRQRAIQRLPAVMQRAYEGFLGEGSWLTGPAERETLQRAFGDRLERLRQIVIVTDEEAVEYAAQASVGPLGSVEVIFSGTGRGRLYQAQQGVMLPIRGIYYRFTYDRTSGAYRLTFEPTVEQNTGVPSPDTTEVVLPPSTTEVTINGHRYLVDPTSFMGDEAGNVTFGLTLRAANPDLLGVNTKVFRASDRALDREVGREDTLFILVSRSNNAHQQNHRIPPIAGGPQDPRTPGELMAPGVVKRPETAMVHRAGQLAAAGRHLLCLCDEASALGSFGQRALGITTMPPDVDDTSLYSVTYLGLLSVGVKLGALRGIQTGSFRDALATVPGLVAEVLRNTELRRRAERFVARFKHYRKVQVIGGGQALSDAKEFARILRGLGVFAEALLNDSAWHGPLATVDPSRLKYANPDARTGINPAFNTDSDTLIFILMTDWRYFATALGGDAQVYDSRNARFGLVTKASDERLDAVQRVGAAEDGIFALADFPDALGSFAAAAAAQYFAALFARTHAQAVLGEEAFPSPAGGLIAESAPVTVPIVFATTTVGAAAADGLATLGDAVQQIAADPQALQMLRDILGPPAGAEETPADLVAQFLAAAQPVLTQAIAVLRQQYPGLPADLPIVIQVGGDRQTRHVPGRIFVNAAALTHPLLVFHQLELGAIAERLQPALDQLALSKIFTSDDSLTSAVLAEIKAVFAEAAVVAAEAGRFTTYHTNGDAADLSGMLEQPNALDPTGQFGRLLRMLWSHPEESWTPYLLDYVKATRPEWAAATTAIEAAYARAPLVVQRPVGTLRRLVEGVRHYASVTWDPTRGAFTVAAPPAAQGREAVERYFKDSPLLSWIKEAAEQFLARQGQAAWVWIGPHPDDPDKTAIVLAMQDHVGIDNAVTSPLVRGDRAAGALFNLAVTSVRSIPRGEGAPPMAVGEFVIQAPESALAAAGVFDQILSGLGPIAQSMEQSLFVAWGDRLEPVVEWTPPAGSAPPAAAGSGLEERQGLWKNVRARVQPWTPAGRQQRTAQRTARIEALERLRMALRNSTIPGESASSFFQPFTAETAPHWLRTFQKHIQHWELAAVPDDGKQQRDDREQQRKERDEVNDLVNRYLQPVGLSVKDDWGQLGQQHPKAVKVGLEEAGVAEAPAGVPEVPQLRTVPVVDLTILSDAPAALYLPDGAIALLTADGQRLLAAVQATTDRMIPGGVQVVVVEANPVGLVEALQQVIGELRAGDSVRLLSPRGEGELQWITGALGGTAVAVRYEMVADAVAMLQVLNVQEALRQQFEDLYQRFKERWIQSTA